jgi:site-specific DNA-methyltransferase (adenine-specific)
MTSVFRHQQYLTPSWAAQLLVERHFAHLSSDDLVLEPSCGAGAFLSAIPDYVPAVGVEIDSELAARAIAATGRQVIVGDFRMVDLPLQPTVVIGNPPFRSDTVHEFLDRAWMLLPDEGRVGFILPCYTFQTSLTVERLAARWSLQQEMIPRDLFPRLSLPICFALLTKGPRRDMVSFSLYHELVAVKRLAARYRALLAAGEGSVWAAVTRAAFEALGGAADLETLYREIEGIRPTTNKFWQAKVRQTVQRIAERVGPGRWALPLQDAA